MATSRPCGPRHTAPASGAWVSPRLLYRLGAGTRTPISMSLVSGVIVPRRDSNVNPWDGPRWRPFRRLRAWWERVRYPRRVREACETCGASLKPKDAHHVTSAFAVDSWEIGGGGGASITATFCAKDCVGACDRERVDA